MKRAVILFAEGYETVEALLVVDLLRRGGVEVTMASITEDEFVRSSHGVNVEMDAVLGEVDVLDYDAIILPGGMPGTMHLKEHAGLAEQIREFDRQGKWLAAICAAPSVFGGLGILEGKKAICFPGFEKYLTGADITPERVVLDGHIFTSKGMGTAIDLGLAIVKEISGEEVSEELAKSIQYR